MPAHRLWLATWVLVGALGACAGKTLERAGDTSRAGGSAVAPTQGGSGVSTAPAEAPDPAAPAGSPSTTQGGAGGSNSGSAGAFSGLGGGTTVSGTVPPLGTCTKTSDCAGTGFFCSSQTNLCSCATDHPTACGTGAAVVCTSLKTDPSNCGACGTFCDAGAACASGSCGSKPTELVAAAAVPGCGTVRLAIQGTNLYWVEPMNGKIRAVAVAGGAAKDIATAQTGATQIAATAKGVYWMIPGTDATTPGKVMKLALPLVDGAQPVVLKTGADRLLGFTAHGDYVYYSLETDVHQISSDETVTTDSVVGVSVNYDNPDNPIATGEPTAIAVNDTWAVWASGARNDVESHTLTEVSDIHSMMGHAQLGRGIGALLLSGDMGIDAQYGYWADADRIRRNRLDAATADAATVTAAPNANAISAFVSNASDVYAAAEDGQLFKHSLTPPADPNDDAGLVPVLVARDQLKVTSMVLDATKLYWVTSDCAFRSIGL